MIDFRYHVVSIVAVFLSLALGLFLGSTTLQGAVFSDLQKRVDKVESQKNALLTQVDQMGGQLGEQRAFDQLVEPYAVAGRLSGQLVVVVSAPGASGEARSRLMTTLEQAGATVTADVRLQAAMLDPKQDAFLGGLADRLSVPGRPAPSGSGAERAVAQIADVLGVRPEVRPLPASTVANVLTAYTGGNLLTTPPVHGNEPRPGTLVVLLAGAPMATTTDPAIVQTQQSLLGVLARDLDAASLGAVIAGPLPATGQKGDLVLSVRSVAGSGVSTVRGVDQSAGRVATVFALLEQIYGKSGSYGLTSGSVPLPTPSP